MTEEYLVQRIGGLTVREWMHKDADARRLMCEIRDIEHGRHSVIESIIKRMLDAMPPSRAIGLWDCYDTASFTYREDGSILSASAEVIVEGTAHIVCRPTLAYMGDDRDPQHLLRAVYDNLRNETYI